MCVFFIYVCVEDVCVEGDDESQGLGVGIGG